MVDSFSQINVEETDGFPNELVNTATKPFAVGKEQREDRASHQERFVVLPVRRYVKLLERLYLLDNAV